MLRAQMDPFFTTDRLVFRPFEPGDLDRLADLVGDPQVARYVGDGRPLPRADVARWIDVSRGNVARHGYGTGALTDRASGALIGWGGMARPEAEPEELIYGFDKRTWGRGLATEFVRGYVTYARDRLRLPNLRATLWAENRASAAVLARVGFVLLERLVEDGGTTEVWSLKMPGA